MKVEIKDFTDADSGQTLRGLFFDGEFFDWGMEPESIAKAKTYSLRDESSKKAVLGDIQKNFLDSLAEFLGTPVTLERLNRAIAEGEL